jgi:hypothetical protein
VTREAGIQYAAGSGPGAASRAAPGADKILSMFFPIPQLNVTWTGGNKKEDAVAKSDVAKSEAPLQFTYAVDPVMLLMVTALVLLSGAMLVYAARS